MTVADLYDFDKTVFRGESGCEFYLFCLRKNPGIIRFFPGQLWYVIRYFLFKSIPMAVMKEKIYCFLPAIDGERMAELFWEKNAGRMCDWFRPAENDVQTVICSASPEFQIKPICDRLGVHRIVATDIDVRTGKISGKNCKGDEKVKRLAERLPEYEFRDAYSDNLRSDAGMLSLAKRDRYRVKDGKLFKI